MKKVEQCKGLGCIKPATLKSKYCSKECGLKLATRRIIECEPQTPLCKQLCEADTRDKNALDEIDSFIERSYEELGKANKMQQKLDELIQRARTTKITNPVTHTEEYIDEGVTNCCICGLDINVKVLLRHVDRCFGKHECQTAFGSSLPSKVPGMFCDVYDNETGIYCKRLKSVCPEHNNDNQSAEDGICGRPLTNDFFKNDVFNICQQPKSSCNKHYKWERIAAAQIDLMKLRQYAKIDELADRKELLRHCIARRNSIIGFMLHNRLEAERKDDDSVD